MIMLDFLNNKEKIINLINDLVIEKNLDVDDKLNILKNWENKIEEEIMSNAVLSCNELKEISELLEYIKQKYDLLKQS